MKYKLLINIIIFVLAGDHLYSGPPFNTDDPEPAELYHWEFYLSSASIFFHNEAVGTLPHLDMNYGAFKNAHLHLMVPLNYMYDNNNKLKFSYNTTEIGIKYRFLEETFNFPQIGIFPALEIPKSFNMKDIQIFLPIWFQKSFDNFTTYGGIGYWINPGEDNLNWMFAGWQVQYKFSDIITQGIELIYHSKQTNDDLEQFSINYGGSININEYFHFLFSAGHSLNGNNCYLAYLGILVTI